MLTSTLQLQSFYHFGIDTMYYNTQMIDQSLLTKQIAYKLIRIAKRVTQPGTGLHFSSNKYEEIKNQFIKIVVCDFQQVERYFEKDIHMCLSISKEHTNSIEKLTHHYQQKLSKVFQCESVKTVLLEYSSENAKGLLSILRFFQSKECFVFIKSEFVAQNFNQYQMKLAQISENLFQQPMLVLRGISLIIDLPLMTQKTLQQYAITLMAVWNRIIPPSLGSLVITDWINSGQTKSIFSLHFLKNMKLHWSLQFLTDTIEHSEALGCECIGIN